MVHETDRRVGSERHLAGEQLVGHRPERVLVGGGGEHLAAALLGAHVGGRADGAAGGGQAVGLGSLGDAEVGDDHAAVVVHHDVAGLDIAVHDAAAMRMREPGRHLAQDDLHGRDRQRAGLLDDRVEWPPHQALHHEENEPVGLPHREDRQDVGVAEIGRQARFAFEPLGHPRRGEERGGHHLDGDLPVECDLVGQEDRGHPAPPQFPDDLILT